MTIILPYGGPADPPIALTAPVDWEARILALAPRLLYGPRFSRQVAYSLRRMSETVSEGYSVQAYDHLLAAERAAT